MFDTGAAIHVCPWEFGEHFTTYQYYGPPLLNADGSPLKTYGLRTVLMKMTDNDQFVSAMTFTVCDVQEPLLSFSQLKQFGYECHMSQDESYLRHQESGLQIPIHQEGRHFYIRPVGFAHSAPGKDLVVSLLHFKEQPLVIAPQFQMRQTSGGNQDYWEVYRDQGVLRRVHKQPRKLLFTPGECRLPAGIDLSCLLNQRRTIIGQEPQTQRRIDDTWDINVRDQFPEGLGPQAQP